MRIGKIIIGFDFIFLMVALYLIDNDNMFETILIASAVHELGHIIAIKLCRAKIALVYLGAYGAKIEMKLYPIISYKREIIIALAGPFAGAIFGVLLSFAGKYTLAGYSLILTLFNLLPALPMDGGRAVRFLALIFLDETRQEKISKIFNALSACIILTFCVYISVNFGLSPGLLMFCAITSINFLKELLQ